MIVVDRGKLRFLLRGRVITIEVARAYRKGRVYACGAKREACRVEVVDVTELEHGAYELTLRQVREPAAVYLAANPGANRSDYTHNPLRAARDVDGSTIEAANDVRYSREAFARDDRIRRDRASEALQRRTRRYAMRTSLPVKGHVP